MTAAQPGIASSRRSVLKGLSISTLGLAAGSGISSALAAVPGAQRRRWFEQEYRIVQTNLREIDVRENPGEIARALKDFGATAVVSNIGGIVAFYPTAIPLHYKNPYLTTDFVGEMVEAARSNGLSYIGRYDLSKTMKLAYDAHPDWFVQRRAGGPREYEGTYHACPNGGWAQQYAFDIMREGLTRYDADGLFFNMSGYPHTDYSGVDHGICVCENCRTRFRAMYGLELPAKDGPTDPNWKAYLEFQDRTSDELATRMRAFARKLRPDAPLIDYYARDVVGRGEAQRRVDRAAPEWPYQAGEQARTVWSRSPGKPFSATSAAHIDYPWRQVTESADAHILRMAQSLAVGAKLDLYLMGTLADQDDQTWLKPVSDLYKWHAANAQHYAGLTPVNRVVIYQSETTQKYGMETPWGRYLNGSFRGAYSALVDARLPFSLVGSDLLTESKGAALRGYDVVILPHVLALSDAEAAALDAWVREGGLLIATGMSGGYDANGALRSRMALAASPVASFAEPIVARGMSLNDAGAPLDFGGARVAIDGHFFPVTARTGAQGLIPFAPAQRYGPPELSYAIPGDKPRADAGVLEIAYGRGHAVHVPWLPEWQYYRDGLDAHRQLFAALIARFAPSPPVVLTGNGAVELTVQRQAATGKTLVHVVNYAGQRGGRYSAPPAIHGLKLGVSGAVGGSARALVGGQAVRGQTGPDGRTWFELPPVGAFEALQLSDA